MAKKQAEPQPAEEAPKGGKKKLILIIVGALLLVVLSAGVTLLLLGGGEQTEAVAEVETMPQKGPPSYIELKPFTVNLDPQDPVGFLQVQIQILTYDDEVAKELDIHKPLIRNNLSLLFGRQKSADLRSQQGKQDLQQQVRDTIQKIITDYGSGGEVDNVFFTNFVMQ